MTTAATSDPTSYYIIKLISHATEELFLESLEAKRRTDIFTLRSLSFQDLAKKKITHTDFPFIST